MLGQAMENATSSLEHLGNPGQRAGMLNSTPAAKLQAQKKQQRPQVKFPSKLSCLLRHIFSYKSTAGCRLLLPGHKAVLLSSVYQDPFEDCSKSLRHIDTVPEVNSGTNNSFETRRSLC